MDESEPTQRVTSRGTAGFGRRWQAPSVDHLQTMLPQYEVLEVLGQGGMGAVYKGRQKSLRRLVAIKVLPMQEGEDDDDSRQAERFKNEACTLAQMSHPGIVNVFDFGETSEGLLYFVMEFVDGTDVGQMIQSSGKLAPDQAMGIIGHVCEALDYAHKNGVIHRDIKPANVLINRQGQVKVADFGLAKMLNDSALTHALTRSNTAMGTPDYVAPEALAPGVTVDHRADLYAVGVMLYQMVTGEVPRGMFKLPSQKVPAVDRRIDSIVCKAMEQDREERYQTAQDVRRALEEIQTTPLTKVDRGSSPAVPVASGEPPKKMPKQAVSIAVAAAVLLIIGAIFVWRNEVDSKTKPTTPQTVASAGGTSGPPSVTAWRNVTEAVAKSARGMPGFEVTGDAISHFEKAATPIVLPFVDERDFAVRVHFSQQIQVDVRATPQLGFAYALIQGHQTLLQRYRANKNTTVQLAPIVPHPVSFDRAQEHELFLTVVGDQIRVWLDGHWVSEGRDEEGKDGAARILFHANSKVHSVEIAGLPVTAAKIANTSVKAAGRTVDLLALIDPARDTIRGTWTRSPRGISVAPQSGVTVLELPYQPPEEYDYEIEFTPDNDGMNVNQYLSAAGRSFAWKLNSHNIAPPLYGFELLDGRFAKDLREAATQLEAAIEKGRRYQSKIEVRRGGLRALLDGKELVRWSGDFKRFSMEDHSRLRNELHLGIGSWKRAVTFHKIQVTEVTGTGRVDAGGTQAAKWTDWFGPWLAKWIFNGTGWIKEAEGVTTDQQFRGEIVLPATTRDGAVRLGYTMRGSEAASVTFRHAGAGRDRKFYVAYDAGKTLYISRAEGAEQTRLVSESIPAAIRDNMERTLEVRFVGNRLAATLNGSFTVTATDDKLRQGECAMVLHKGALLKRVETLALDVPREHAVNADFMGMIAAVNALRQVELVGEKLKELNGVLPVLTPTIVSGKVTALGVRASDPAITDISPIAALRHLTSLSTDNNKVDDISCLAGLPLEHLSLFGESLTDVSVLKSLPLKTLSLRGSPVADFSLLAGKPLERLQLNLCRELKDISFVKGMPLAYLKIDYTSVRDLSPLAGLPLTELECNPDIKLDAALLRSIPTLKIFNKKPVAELLPPATAAPTASGPGA